MLIFFWQGSRTRGEGEMETLSSKDVINMESLKFKFPGSPEILKGLNMKIPQGSRVLLAGANGSGKTTLLQVREIGEACNCCLWGLQGP